MFYFLWEPDKSNPLFEHVVRHVNGVPVKDMGQWFGGLEKFSLMNSKVDSHPNAEGHRVMAEHMAVEIVSYPAARKLAGECLLAWSGILAAIAGPRINLLLLKQFHHAPAGSRWPGTVGYQTEEVKRDKKV